MTTAAELEIKSKRKTKTNMAKADKPLIDLNIFTQRVEKKAFELYQKRGCGDGRDCDDWFEAEKIVEEEMINGR